MLLTLAHIGSRVITSGAKSGYDSLTRMYLERVGSYMPIESKVFREEEALLEWIGGQRGRTPVFPVLLDSRGRQLSSEDLSKWLGTRRDGGTQHIVFAIGPANGWSVTTQNCISERQHLLLSFGPITMAHELARLVLAEQLYRACTILSGHPYHGGH